MAADDSHSGHLFNGVDETTEQLHAVFIDKIDISSASDEKTAVVCALEAMPDGHLLVCDTANKKIKLVDADSEVLSEIVLASDPHGMVVFDTSEVTVSLPREKCLMNLRIDDDNNITLQNRWKTRARCNKLLKFQGDLITHSFDDSYCYCSIIDRQGKDLRCILKEARNSGGVSSKIRFMCLSLDHKILWITDDVNGCVGLSLDGELMFRHKRSGTSNFWGVCADTAGVVLLACYDTDKVLMMNEKGERMSDLVYVQDMRPCCIMYSETEGKLYVKKGSTNLVLVFQIEYKY